MAVPKRVHIEVANTYAGNQSWYFREIFAQGPYKMRVLIRVNAYVGQSHAKAEVWHEPTRQWNIVHSIPPTKMVSCTKVSYVEKNVGVAPFMADRNALVEMAEKILF